MIKASFINGKGSSVHNDRSYETATTKEKNEVRGKVCIYKGMTFHEAELKFYNEKFSDWLKAKNAIYERNRHKENIKTMEEIVRPNKKQKQQYEPTETILQIGKDGENISYEVFKACINDYMKKIIEKYGKNMTILDLAIHKEESSVYHAHLRRVWYAHDKNGNLYPAKDKALEELGIELPHPEKKKDRYNNRTIAQTEEERQIWYDVLLEHGIVVDRVADLDNADHLAPKEYKRQKNAQEKEIKDRERIIEQQKNKIESNRYTIEEQEKELDEIISKTEKETKLYDKLKDKNDELKDKNEELNKEIALKTHLVPGDLDFIGHQLEQQEELSR